MKRTYNMTLTKVKFTIIIFALNELVTPKICSDDSKTEKKGNKFKQKCLLEPKNARGEETLECSLKLLNGQETWNVIANIQCRTQTVIDDFVKETLMH